jgi:hypothetical protein
VIGMVFFMDGPPGRLGVEIDTHDDTAFVLFLQEYFRAYFWRLGGGEVGEGASAAADQSWGGCATFGGGCATFTF